MDWDFKEEVLLQQCPTSIDDIGDPIAARRMDEDAFTRMPVSAMLRLATL
jgi:hypothetical protein